MPTPPPAPAALSAFSISPSRVQSQQEATGTVTLTTAAPSGGISIDLSTSNRDVARPASSSVTVGSGSTTGSFRIETTTVAESQDVQITARYQSVAINQIIRVTISPPVARFTINSPAKGNDACVIQDDDARLDCSYDATASGGFPRFYNWTFTVGGSNNRSTTTDKTGDLSIQDKCDFFKGRSTATDSNGDRYLNMDIRLVIEDREGTSSQPSTRTVRVFTNGRCGY